MTSRRATALEMTDLVGAQSLNQSRRQFSSRAAETDIISSVIASEELNEFGAPVLIKKAQGDYQQATFAPTGKSPAYSNINDFRRVAYKEDSNGPNYSSMGPASTYRKRNNEPVAEPIINTERINHDQTVDSEQQMFFSAL